MPEPTTLGPADIEIEHTEAGSIIHIFPEEKDPEQVIMDILQGLYLVHKSYCNKKKFDEANEYAKVFMTKMKHK